MTVTPSPYGERLAKALKVSGQGVRPLSDFLNISAQAVYSVLNGKSVTMNSENSARAARFLGVSSHWLSTGEGEMLVAKAPPGSAVAESREVGPLPVARAIAVSGISLAELPASLWDDQGEFIVPVSGTAIVATSDPRAFIVQTEDDANEPRYLAGEYVVVEPSLPVEIEDDMLVRLKDRRTLIARLLGKRAGMRLGFWSDARQPITVNAADVIWAYPVAHTLRPDRVRPA